MANDFCSQKNTSVLKGAIIGLFVILNRSNLWRNRIWIVKHKNSKKRSDQAKAASSPCLSYSDYLQRAFGLSPHDFELKKTC